MSLGEQLRMAREARKQSASQVASATRLKVQVVEAIEREDFSKIPAAIYGKGFIKLYAEHVGLDPHPLIQEYVARFSSHTRPSLESPVEDPEPREAETAAAPDPEPPDPDKEVKRRPRRSNKDFFEPDLFEHAGLSPVPAAPAEPEAGSEAEPEMKFDAAPDTHPLAEPDPQPDPVPPPAAPVLPVAQPRVQPETPRATPPPDLLKVSHPPEPGRPSPAVHNRDSMVQAPAGRDTSDNGPHSPHSWNGRPIVTGAHSVVDPDGLVHRKPVAESAKPATESAPAVADDARKERDEEGTQPDWLDLKSLSLSRSPLKAASLLLGIIVILLFVISGLSRCTRKPTGRPVPVVIEADKELHVAVPPPAPYFD